jgi:hypothetical protein
VWPAQRRAVEATRRVHDRLDSDLAQRGVARNNMQMEVTLDGSRTSIEREVFVDLLDNSVANGRAGYLRALDTREIAFTELVDLARKADIPYSLFFASHTLVQAQLRAKSEKLLQGLTKATFSLNSRSTVDLRDIELIVKDLLRKQELLKKHDSTLVKNPIAGLLRRPGRSVEDDARILTDALGLDRDSIRAAKNKESALELMIKHLEARQVLVSRSVNNFMPQRLQGVKFSGMTIKDTKVPYIFLSGGDHGDSQEPAGRQIFTLTLMAVLVARGIFAPVTYDGRSSAPNPGREYDIVGQILMPVEEMRQVDHGSLNAIKAAADLLKVTPSALVVRALRLGFISPDSAGDYLDELDVEYSNRKSPKPRTPKTVNAIRKYNGREFSMRMLDALDARKLTARDFCRTVCSNKIKPHEINDFRGAIK